jgi:ABC-2 type transport system ATP-binding protein
MEPFIAVENVTFDYPGVRALDDVSVAVREGSVTALVGPNGAGKTTLMRCIAALDRPQAGRIRVAGLDVHAQPRQAHTLMGYLPDFFGLYDTLTVRQCLLNRAAALDVPAAEREARVTAAATAVGLADRLQQRAGELSRGLRQRLAIGQSLVHGPRVLILDEPASGLDPEARQALSALMLRLSSEGVTLLVSSHILAELQDYSTDMLIIRDGRVVDHRAVGPNAAAAGRGLLSLRLAAPDDRLAAALAEVATEVVVDGADARFLGPAEASERAALLRRLVEAGLAIVAFGEPGESLQAQYLARLRQSQRGGGR